MPRDYRSGETQRRARARRESALQRQELNEPSQQRIAAAGPVSMGVKPSDPDHDRMVAEYLASKRGDK